MLPPQVDLMQSASSRQQSDTVSLHALAFEQLVSLLLELTPRDGAAFVWNGQVARPVDRRGRYDHLSQLALLSPSDA